MSTGPIMLVCPYPGCSFTTDELRLLRIHAMRSHRLKEKCPACGRKYRRVLLHLSSKAAKDEKHAVFYALHRPGKYGGNNIHTSAKDLAVHLLKVECLEGV